MSSRRKALEGIFNQSSEKLAAANFGEDEVPRSTAGPVRTMALSLGKLGSETRAMQEALSSGQYVQELDPALVEPSFVRDRLDQITFAADDPFLISIQEQGQEVPILVRPHPNDTSRYQVAYGHRRLKAAATLGVKVRAIVREFSDEQLVIAQGVENNDRQNLSYIEKAVFAAQLGERDFPRRVIMAALSTDKTELSKLLSVASAVPLDIIRQIGSAPATGRRKWQTFAAACTPERRQKLRRLLQTSEVIRLGSDERFERAFIALTTEDKEQPSQREWRPERGEALAAVIRPSKRSYAVTLKHDHANAFGEFLTDRLDALYEEFLRSTGD